jgi:hypothetical protein
LLCTLNVEENGAMVEWSQKIDMKRTIVALRTGVALSSRWGSTLPKAALESIVKSMEYLDSARKALHPLVLPEPEEKSK